MNLKNDLRSLLRPISLLLIGMLSFYSSMSFSEIDFESFFKLRTEVQNIQNSNYSTLSTDQTFRLKGIIRPSEVFETHFWLLSHAYFDKDPQGSVRLYVLGKWFLNKELSLVMGRIPYESHFHEIISTNSIETYPYFLDGLFVNYSTRLIHLDIFGAYMPKQYIETQELPSLRYGTGVFLDLHSISEFFNHVNLHLVYLSNSFFKEESEKTTRYGAAIDGNVASMNLDYKLIGIAHGDGFKFRSNQSMYHVELAYTKLEWSGSRFFVGYHSDTENYNPWLYNRYKNAGFLQLFLWGNLTYAYAGYKTSFFNFDFQLVFHNMKSTARGKVRLGQKAYRIDRSVMHHQASAPKEFLGRELDMIFIKKMNDEFKILMLVGAFQPGGSVKNLLKGMNYYTNIKLTGVYKF